MREGPPRPAQGARCMKPVDVADSFFTSQPVNRDGRRKDPRLIACSKRPASVGSPGAA